MNFFNIKFGADFFDQELLRGWLKKLGAECIQTSDGLFVATSITHERLQSDFTENKFANATIIPFSPDLEEATPEMKRLMDHV